MTAPSPSLVADSSKPGSNPGSSPDPGRGLDIDRAAADLTSLIGVPREPRFLDDLYTILGAYAGFDEVSPFVADIIGDAVAAAIAAILIERAQLGGDIALRVRNQLARHAMPAAQAWPDHAGGERARDILWMARKPAPPTDGQICALFAVDIAGFTRPDRDDDIRRHLHEELYRFLAKAFDDSGIPWASCFHEDRGDGALVVVPPGIAVKGIVHPLPERLRGLIRRHNHVSCEAAKIQLRAAAHIGPVEHDGNGFVGSDINLLFRMLEARPLKRALATSDAELALIVSDYVYHGLVCRYQSLMSPDDFHEVRFQVKRTRARAWTHLP